MNGVMTMEMYSAIPFVPSFNGSGVRELRMRTIAAPNIAKDTIVENQTRRSRIFALADFFLDFLISFNFFWSTVVYKSVCVKRMSKYIICIYVKKKDVTKCFRTRRESHRKSKNYSASIRDARFLSLCIDLPPVFSPILCTARMCSTKRAASQIINGPKIKHNQ